MIEHLKLLPPVQCGGCPNVQEWLGEMEFGAMSYYLIENHAPECPYFEHHGRRREQDEVCSDDHF